jgi:hypothetical protein
MTSIVASICCSTVAGAAASSALVRVAAHVLTIVSIWSTRCCASVARLVSLSLSATSLERIACHESVRLASAFAEGEDSSASVVLTWRLRIQSAASLSQRSASSDSELSGACPERRNVVTCSARWAISGIGIGARALAADGADGAVTAGEAAGGAGAATAGPTMTTPTSTPAPKTTAAQTRRPRRMVPDVPTVLIFKT